MKRVEEKLILKSSIKQGIQKSMFIIIIGLSAMILIKNHPNSKEWIKSNLFENSLPVLKVRNLYEKYMTLLPKNETKPVWKEKYISEKEEKTDTGIRIKAKENDIVKIKESGLLIYLDDEKVILEQVDGVTATYHNVKINNYKLYDYLEKNDTLGVATSNEVRIDYQKDGQYYEYKKNI